MRRRRLVQSMWLMLIMLIFGMVGTAYAKNSPAINAARSIMMRQAVHYCKECEKKIASGGSTVEVEFECNLEKQYELYGKELLREEKREAARSAAGCISNQSEWRHYYRNSAERSFTMPIDAGTLGKWVENYIFQRSMLSKAVRQAKVPAEHAPEVKEALQLAIEDYIIAPAIKHRPLRHIEHSV